ncbi:MAG: hypothetical protein ACP5JP_02660 [bacterium]
MDKRIHLYIDNELDEQSKRAFEQDLLKDKQLYEEYTKMLNLLTLVKEHYPRVNAPSGITDNVIEKITTKEASITTRKLLVGVAAIVVLVLSVTGVFMFAHRADNLVTITFKVSLPDAKNVYLLGTFNKWGEKPEKLKRTDNGLFTITLKLKPGIYQYVYKVDDNKIIPDPGAMLYTEDGFGQKNAILIVKSPKNS